MTDATPSATAGAVFGRALPIAIVRALACGVLIGVVPMGGRAIAQEVCSAAGEGPTIQVAAVMTRLELRLDDGRLIRLAGLDPALPTPDAPDLDETTRASFAALIAGQPLTFWPTTTTPDRWGRIVGRVFAPSAGTIADLTATAIAAGLGRYRAEPAAHPCRAAFLAAESRARLQKLGVWADPYYAVLAVDDRAGFAERAGTLVVAEGRLASIEHNVFRHTLIFTSQPNRSPTDTAHHAGSRGSQVLSATIPSRAMKIFEAHGVQLSSLTGRVLRLRGLLDLRFGPQIELLGPDDVEVLEAGTGPAQTGLK